MFQWLTNGSGRPAGPLGGSVVSLRISTATFRDAGLGFAVSAATGTAPRLKPIATAEQNKPQMVIANLVFIAVRPLYFFLSSY